MNYYFINIPDSYGGGVVYMSSDGDQFPADQLNRHYRDYLAWVADGNTAEEWQPVAVEPETIQPDMEEEV
jgi:hypothetical protein